MRHLFLIGLVLATTPAAAGDRWCAPGSQMQRVNGAAFVLWTGNTGDILVDAGSVGSGIPGRVFWNPQSDEKIGVITSPDKTSIEVDRNGTTTTYHRCE